MTVDSYDYFAEPAPSAVGEPPPVIRVMALHALMYCERLFIWRRSKESTSRTQKCSKEANCMKIWSRESRSRISRWKTSGWGLVGRLDAVRRRDGGTIEYEHKKGCAGMFKTR